MQYPTNRLAARRDNPSPRACQPPAPIAYPTHPKADKPAQVAKPAPVVKIDEAAIARMARNSSPEPTPFEIHDADTADAERQAEDRFVKAVDAHRRDKKNGGPDKDFLAVAEADRPAYFAKMVTQYCLVPMEDRKVRGTPARARSGPVFGLMMRKTSGDYDRAKDFTQDTAAKAIKCGFGAGRGKFNPTVGSLLSWLFTVADHTRTDYIRKATQNGTAKEQTFSPKMDGVFVADDVWGAMEVASEYHNSQTNVGLRKARKNAQAWAEVVDEPEEFEHSATRSSMADSFASHREVNGEVELGRGGHGSLFTSTNLEALVEATDAGTDAVGCAGVAGDGSGSRSAIGTVDTGYDARADQWTLAELACDRDCHAEDKHLTPRELERKYKPLKEEYKMAEGSLPPAVATAAAMSDDPEQRALLQRLSPMQYFKVWHTTQKLRRDLGEDVPEMSRKEYDRAYRKAEAEEAKLKGEPTPSAKRMAKLRAEKPKKAKRTFTLINTE
jgi:DNA-directed RNA polymerase specialized sigma24 family protein